MKKHRIAAGGITIYKGKILLVRYRDGSDGYFAAPGGGVKDCENIKETIIRETLEETGITVEPDSVLMIEDLDCSEFKMCKIWMNCQYKSGEISETKEAEIEGIVEAGWYTQEDIENEKVFPSIIKSKSWGLLQNTKNNIEIPLTRKTSF